VGAQGRDYSTEEKLGDLEQLFGLPYWRAITDGFVDLSAPSTRKGLALLAAVMFLRNPARLKHTADLPAHLRTEFSKTVAPPEAVQCGGRRIELDPMDWNDFRIGGEDFIKRIWLRQIDGAQELARIFLEMRWSMHATQLPIFITSDDPVVAIHQDLVFRGFRNPGTSVIFPLSPTRVLHLDWRRDHDDGGYYQSVETFPAINFILWRNCIDCMFSQRHPNEVCAEIIAHADAQAA